jgi:hypothetical protein
MTGSQEDVSLPWWLVVLASEKQKPYFMNYVIIGSTSCKTTADRVVEGFDCSHMDDYDLEELFCLRQPDPKCKYICFVFDIDGCHPRATFLTSLEPSELPGWRPIRPEEASKVEPFSKILQYFNPTTGEMATVLPLQL